MAEETKAPQHGDAEKGGMKQAGILEMMPLSLCGYYECCDGWYLMHQKLRKQDHNIHIKGFRILKLMNGMPKLENLINSGKVQHYFAKI